MKKFKAISVLALVIIILCTSVVPIFAEQVAESEVVIKDDELVAYEDEGPLNNDKKIICQATIDEDFDNNSLLVVLKNEASLNFDNYDVPEFTKVKPKTVREITTNKSERIHNEFVDKKTTYTKALRDTVNSNNIASRSSIAPVVNDELTEKIIQEDAKVISKAEIEEEYSYYHKIIYIQLNTSSKQSVLDAIKEIEKDDSVLAAEPNYRLTTDGVADVVNDTYKSELWNLDNISAPSAWNTTTGSSSVKVGVIDDGIDATHPDLAGNINTALSTSFTDLGATTSVNGHGTKVAGVVGAVGNNSRGITGVCWDVSLVSLQVRDSNNMTISSYVVNAIQYAEDNNIDILNISNSFKGNDNAYAAAIKSYSGLIICSASNQGANIDTTTDSDVYKYPSLYTSSNLISVASIDSSNKLATDSNYGATSVDLAAPGEGVYTTDGVNDYDYASGTSFSAPHVAGVAALIKSKYPAITTKGIKKAILDGVTKVSSLSGKVKTGGKLNANSALNKVGAVKYTLVYDANGGTGTMANTTITYGFFTKLRNNTYTKQYHNFAGWHVYMASTNKYYYKKGSNRKWYVEGSEPSGYTKVLYANQTEIAHTTTTNNAVITMIATWSPYTYTVRFDGNGGGGAMSPKVCEYNATVTIPSASYTNAGYVFGGWKAHKTNPYGNKLWLYKNGNTYNWYMENSQPSGYSIVTFNNGATFTNITNVDKDIIYFVAQWTPNSYNINYDANGGAGSMQDTIGYTNQNVQLRNNTFNKPHCLFKGWYIVDSDGYWSVITNMEWDKFPSSESDKRLYENQDYLSYTADYLGVEVNAIAQWIVLGDSNLDGNVSIMDVTLIQTYLAQSATFTDEQITASDVDGDGIVTIIDVTCIQQFLAQIITEFPVESN